MKQQPATPSLGWVDAWLLATLTAHRWRWSRPMKLRDLIDRADVLFRGQPTFDDASFSLPRLLAAGYIAVDRDAAGYLRIKATREGFDLKARVKGKAHPLTRMAQAVGVTFDPSVTDEDRSLGRYSDLKPAEWQAAEDALAPRDIQPR